MNTQITEMAKRFMVEQYGPCPSDHETMIMERDRWDEKLGLVILAIEFALNETRSCQASPRYDS